MGRIRTAGILAAVLALAGQPAEGGGQPKAGQADAVVSVYIENWAGVSDDVLGNARDVAGKAFQDAGIEIRWDSCRVGHILESECGREMQENEILVQIRPGGHKTMPNAGGQATPSDAQRGRGLVVIYYGRLKRTAEELSLARGVALGYVMAHEIGHLLLPTGEHSSYGVMRARLDRVDWLFARQSRLHFDNQQAGKMRAGILVRSRKSMAAGTTGNVLP